MRFRKRSDGRFSVSLHQNERDLLASLPDQLIELLAEGDASLARLFPPAYVDDLERDREYQRLMNEDLLIRKKESAQILAATAHAKVLEPEQMMRWMGAVNDLRLVIGTQLNITEDDEDREDFYDLPDDDPQRYRFIVYMFLTALLSGILTALMGDDRRSGAPDESGPES
jgi:Domain of unknown function (DUF2017)